MNKISNGIFCSYVTGEVGGKCLMYCPDNLGLCHNHREKKPKEIKQKGVKFRGDSKWQKEQGYFKNK